MKILRVVENREVYLMLMMKIKEKMTKELASMIPGDPAVHLTALRQTKSQKKRNMSPGSDKDCSRPKIEKLYERRFKSQSKNGRVDISKTERAIIAAAMAWYESCTGAGKFKMSSKVAPTISTKRAITIGIVKLSSLKKIINTRRTGIVIAKPPSDGVTPSCKAFSGLSLSFLPLFGTYVTLFFNAIYPINGVNTKETKAPIKNIGQYCIYFSYSVPTKICGVWVSKLFKNSDIEQ